MEESGRPRLPHKQEIVGSNPTPATPSSTRPAVELMRILDRESSKAYAPSPRACSGCSQREFDWVLYVPNENQWELDDESQNNQQQGNGLRAQLERSLAEIKALKESNAALSKQAREATISSHIKEKGLNPKIAKLIPGDVESTDEAITKWFEENADLFPAPPKEGQGEGEGQSSEADDEDPEQAELIGQMNRMANVANAGRIPQRQEDLLAKISSADMTQEKLLELINASGGGYGSG